MNANITSQILANYGYAVCDISYGDLGWFDASEEDSKLERGYDLPDTIFHVAKFLDYIESNSDYYHVDVSNTAVVGRSWGGLMTLILGYAYQHPFYSGNFSSNLHINSLVSYYPTSKILTGGTDVLDLGLSLFNQTAPFIRGSDNPDSNYYNSQWKYFDPYYLSSEASGLSELPKTLLLQGTHDFGIPPAWTRDFASHLKRNNRVVITGY
jgi:acetyl esterase/lipase